MKKIVSGRTKKTVSGGGTKKTVSGRMERSRQRMVAYLHDHNTERRRSITGCP
jgi:hypothetical protein